MMIDKTMTLKKRGNHIDEGGRQAFVLKIKIYAQH